MKKLIEMSTEELREEVVKLRGKIRELNNSKEQLQITEVKLEESELRLKSILNNAMAVVYVKNKDGKYLFINRRYEELFHVSLNEIIGKTDYDFHSKEFADRFAENDNAVIESEAPVEFEEEANHDDGVHNYISLKFPLFNKDGDLYAVCGISTDITLRKKAEKEKEQVIYELKEALSKVKKLSGLIPICSICKRIRDDHGYWRAVEKYVEENSNIKFTDGMCPECYAAFKETDDNTD